MEKPPPVLTPGIIADLRAGEECADPDYPGLRVWRTNAARGFFYRYRAPDGSLREIKLREFGRADSIHRFIRRSVAARLLRVGLPREMRPVRGLFSKPLHL